MTPERRVKKAVEEILKEFGVYYFFVPANGYGRSGIPDIVGCCNGHFFSIECKANGGSTTLLQDMELNKITAAGGRAWVIDEHSVEAVRTLLGSLR